MKYKIKDGYKPWTGVSSIEHKCDGIKVDKFNGNKEGCPFVKFDSESLGSI